MYSVISRLYSRIRVIEEHIDPQYSAVCDAISQVPVSYVVANALVSYQLSGTGEQYWREFGDYFMRNSSSKLYSDFERFLESSRYNRRLTRPKLKRLTRLDLSLIDLDWTFNELWEFLGDVFGKNKKTVVFAVKMFGYAKRCVTNSFEPFPMEIPIPVDSRISKITSVLTSENPCDFWTHVARETGVPPLHIDSILWNAYRYGLAEIRSSHDFENVLVEFYENISNHLNVL